MSNLLESRAHVTIHPEQLIILALDRCQVELIISIRELKVKAVETFKLGDSAIDTASTASCLHIDLIGLIRLTQKIRVKLVEHFTNCAASGVMIECTRVC